MTGSDSIPVPRWIITAGATLVVGAIPLIFTWCVTLEVSRQSWTTERAALESKVRSVEAKLDSYGTVKQDLAVIKTELGFVKTLLQAERQTTPPP